MRTPPPPPPPQSDQIGVDSIITYTLKSIFDIQPDVDEVQRSDL